MEWGFVNVTQSRLKYVVFSLRFNLTRFPEAIMFHFVYYRGPFPTERFFLNKIMCKYWKEKNIYLHTHLTFISRIACTHIQIIQFNFVNSADIRLKELSHKASYVTCYYNFLIIITSESKVSLKVSLKVSSKVSLKYFG